jgi:hypothetical protein
LTSLRNTLAADQATVNGEAQALLNLTNEEAALALTHSEGMTYAGLKALIGTAEAPGRLQELEGILNAVPPAAIGLTRQGLLDGFEAARRGYEERGGIIAKLQARSSQVSFKDLYAAVLALQATEGDHCPACDTPLAGQLHVVVNPYIKATDGLAELKELGELQEERETVQAEVATASRALRRQLATLAAFVAAKNEQDTPVGQYLAGLAAEPAEDWWTAIFPARPENDTSATADAVTLDQILAVADRVVAQDAASLLASQERQRNIEERDSLNEFRLSVQAQDLKRQQLVDGVVAARDRIAAFDTANATLITEVAQEALDIAGDAPIKAAYDGHEPLQRVQPERLGPRQARGAPFASDRRTKDRDLPPWQSADPRGRIAHPERRPYSMPGSCDPARQEPEHPKPADRFRRRDQRHRPRPSQWHPGDNLRERPLRPNAAHRHLPQQ